MMKIFHLSVLSILTTSISSVAGAECTKGKLYLSSRNSTIVHVYDLNRSLQSMFNERNVTLNVPTNELVLDVTSDSLHVIVSHRGTADVGFTNGAVNWIHTGFEKMDHDDHYHLLYGPPTLVTSAKLVCGRPTHFKPRNGKTALFCDGFYDFTPQTNSSFWVINEAKLGTGENPLEYSASLLGAHHGIAVTITNTQVLHTLPTPARVNRAVGSTSAPDTFQVVSYSGSIVHSITDTSNKDQSCSGFHGNVDKGNAFAYACDEKHGGILIVNYNPVSATYTSRALFYPTGFDGFRSSSLVTHDKSSFAVGNFGFGATNYLLAFDLSDTGTLTNSSLLALPVRQCSFLFEKSDGEYILNFMPNGTLFAYTYDKVSSWKLVAQVFVVPGMTACTQAALVAGHLQAFVMHYSSRTLYAVDLANVKTGILTVTTTSLPFVPNSGVVAGAPELYSCALNPKEVVATVAPSALPSASPVSFTAAPVSSPNQAPAATPTTDELEPCGMFGLSILCFGSGKCGFFRRLLNIGGC